MTSTNHLSLMTRAARVIDSLDDIDSIATIGGPMDELATLVDDLAHLDAVTALVRTGTEIARVVRAFDSCAEPPWRTTWLAHHAGLDKETARTVASLDTTDLTRFADDARDEMARSSLVSAIDAVTRDLITALAPYPQVETPDTVPADWPLDSLDG